MAPARAYAELRGSGPVHGLRLGARVWWATLASGRFFTWWSALVSLLISVTVLGAYRGVDGTAEYLPAVGVSALVWVGLCALILPVAWAERHLRSRRARAVLVLSAIVIVGAARPVLNDLASLQLLEEPATGAWPERMLTNVLSWLLVLSIVAIATVGYDATRAASTRLRTALADLGEADARADAFARGARIRLVETVEGLRERLGDLVSGDPGFEDVRAFSQEVRRASHDLEDAAAVPLSEVTAGTGPTPVAVPVRRPFLDRLRPPQPLVVSGVYVVVSLPYTLNTVPPWLALTAIALVFACGLLAEEVTRKVSRRRPGRVRGAAVIASWFGAGLLFSAAAVVLAPETLPIALVPIVVFPGLAVIVAISSDAIRSSIVQTRKLTRILVVQTDAVAARTASARRMLRAAAERLHGQVQGRCVLFAAAVDDRPATAEELTAFEATVDRAFGEIEGTPAVPAATTDALADMLETWSHVLDISSAIDDRARPALAGDDVTRRVVDIASEGFLNAVKHSGAKRAQLAVTLDPSDTALSVEVASPGRLSTAFPLAAGRGVAHLGAQVYQRGRDVVLVARVPLTAG